MLHNNYQRVLDAKAKYDENVKKKDALKQESQVTNEKIDADRAVISQSIITIMKRLEIYQEDEEKSPYVVNNVVFTEVEYGIIRNYLLPYSEFRLYCTNTESLIFKTSDYPYGSDRFNIHDFYVACRMRFAEYTRIRAHHFATNHSSSKEKAAFDALSLSLFLIRTYEREETVPDDDVDIPKIDPITFKNMLVNSWNKVNLARDKALENNSKYFDLTYFEDGPESMAQQYEEKRTIDQDIAEMKRTVYLNDFEKDVEFQYSHITNIALHKDVDMIRQDDSDIDSAMSKYLLKRDITKEADVQSESIIKKKDWTKFTEKCPSQTDYELLVRKKEEKISKCLGKSLSVEFATIDYDEEKKQADKIYDDYKRTEKSMGKSLVGDVVFLILAVLAMLIPYALLQRSAEGAFTAESWLLYLLTGGVFAGLFIIVLLARVIPIANKLRLLKFQMQKVYETVIAKQRLASGELTERYANDLIVVEEERYRIRQITYFHNLNLEKEKHIAKHRELLEIVENYISGMLNNLGVVPQKNYNIRIEGEFNIDKPIYSNENKIYKIFSLEAIEDLYPKKGE